MTISNEDNKDILAGDGALLIFPYTWKIFLDSHIQVKIIDTVTDVETLLVLTTDYTVSDVENPAGGNVTLLLTGQLSSAPDSDDEIVLTRILPLTQLIDYVENDPFPAESHEEGLDIGIMIDQQLQEQLDRALLIPSNIVGVDTSLPPPLAGAPIGWNNAADGLTNNPSGINKVAVDIDGAADFLGTDGTDGVLRAGTNITMVEDGGGDFVTIAVTAAPILTSITIGAVTINEFSTDGTFTSPSAQALVTELAIKTYVDAQVLLNNSLDEAYDAGTPGSGSGRVITADAGAVTINGTTTALEITSSTGSDDIVSIQSATILTGDGLNMTGYGALISGAIINIGTTSEVLTVSNLLNLDQTGNTAAWSGSMISAISLNEDTEPRTLIFVRNDSPIATGTTVATFTQDAAQDTLFLNSNANGVSIRIDSETTTQPIISVDAPTLTEGYMISCVDADLFTTGGFLDLISDAPSGAARHLIHLENTDTGNSANAAICLHIVQNSNALAVDVTGNVSITGKLTVTGLIDPTGLNMVEQAADPASTGAGEGTIWVRNDTPSSLIFTDDTGTDIVIAGGGSLAGNTLDLAYDEGSSGGGRSITVDSGAVELTAPDAANNDALSIIQLDTASARAIVITTGANGIDITTTASAGDGIKVSGSNITTGNLIEAESTSDTLNASNMVLFNQSSSIAVNRFALAVLQSSTEAAMQINANGNGAHILLNGDPTVASPSDGELWYTGTALNFFDGSSTTNLLAGGGGSGSLQDAYDNGQIIVATDTTTTAVTLTADSLTSGIGQLINVDGLAMTTAIGLSILNDTNSTGNTWVGSLLSVVSNNSDSSTRNLVEFRNDHVDADNATVLRLQQAGNEPALRIIQDGSGNSINIDHNGGSTALEIRTDTVAAGAILIIADSITTGQVLQISADALETGTGLDVSSSSTDNSTRFLVDINNLSTGSLVTALRVRSAGSQSAQVARIEGTGGGGVLTVVGANVETQHGVAIVMNGLISGQCLNVSSNSTVLTAGNMARFRHTGNSAHVTELLLVESTNPNSGSRMIANFINNDSGATSTRIIRMQQDADSEFMLIGGASVGADTTSAISTFTTPGAIVGFMQVDFNGVGGRWIAIYANPSA